MATLMSSSVEVQLDRDRRPNVESHGAAANARSRTASPELKFVTSTGPPSSRTKESRLVVRSHAMQAFLREKKGDGKDVGQRDPEAQVKSLDESLGRFKLASWSRKSSRKVTPAAKEKKSQDDNSYQYSNERRSNKIVPVPSNKDILGHLDPFAILPITITSRTRYLLHYYATAFTMNSVAVNPEGSFMAFALTDAALLHAILSMVALHFDLVNGRGESEDYLHHKGQAIRGINERLDDSERSTNDTSVATVAIFTNVETMNGTRSTSDVHMAALEKMVNIRGGLDNFKHNKVLQRVLTWSDILYSSTWHTAPRFSLLQAYKSNDPISTLESFSSALDATLAHYEPNLWSPSNLSMSSVLEILRRASKAIVDPNRSAQQRTAISNQIYLLEHHLLSYQAQSQYTSPKQTPTKELYEHEYPSPDPFPFPDFSTLSTSSPDLSEPFRLASLLYTHVVLRELPRTARMHSAIVTSLKTSLVFILRNSLQHLPAALLQPVSTPALEILAWIAFMGAVAASDAGERVYFIKLLRMVYGALGVDAVAGAEEVLRVLRGVVWHGGVCEGLFWGVWEEVVVGEDLNLSFVMDLDMDLDFDGDVDLDLAMVDERDWGL